jgi:hypothetical protein
VLASSVIGTQVHDSVLVASSTGPSPLGTVDFNLYQNTTCSGTPVTQSGVLLASGVAESATTTVSASGLSYKVHYNGQTDVYAPADGICEVLTPISGAVTVSTTLSSTTVKAGTSVYDSVILTGTTANATGTVSYNVYVDSACTLATTSAGTKIVTNATVPNSDSVQFNTVGTFYWQASYSGDQNNSVAKSVCLDEALSVLATSTPPVTGTGSISGTMYNDLTKNGLKDAGDPGIGGFTVNLYKGMGWWGPRHNKSPIQAIISDANGNYSFTGLASGTYSIEEIRKPGWRQLTGDYRRVVLSNGESITGKDFGNASTTPKIGKKEHKDNDDDRDDHKEQKKEDKKLKNMDRRFQKFQEFLKMFEIWKTNHQNN